MIALGAIIGWRYHRGVIRSFRCRDAERIFRREHSRRSAAIEHLALRKLLLLEGAERAEDLRVPPGNHLERLVGDRAGQYSIRINAQWRICFRWVEGAAHDVEIVDYH